MQLVEVPSEGLPAYIPGAIDSKLDEAFGAHGFVLVIGNTFAGKSRALREAITRNFPRAPVLVPPGPTELSRLLALDPPLLEKTGTVVIWLDELGRYLDPTVPTGTPVGPQLFRRHLQGQRRQRLSLIRSRVVFGATISRHDYERLSSERRRILSPAAAAVLAVALPVQLQDDPREAGWDLDVARQLYPALDFSGGVGRAFGEIHALIDAYRSEDNELAQAIVRAAIDWRRIGAGVPEEADLRALLPIYLPGSLLEQAELQRALKRANRLIAERQRMVNYLSDGSFEANKNLIEADEGYGPDGQRREPPESVWRAVAALCDPSCLVSVASVANERGVPSSADTVFGSMFARHDVDATTCARLYLKRGRMRADDGRASEAEADYTAAIETDAADADTRASAYLNRGFLRAHQPERTAEAEADYTAAIETDGAHAATRASAYLNRGFLRADQAGRASEVETDYTAAIETDGAHAATRASAYLNRGFLRADQPGRASEVETDYTAAIETDDAGADTRAIAYMDRGALRANQAGRASEAETDYTAAIETDAADADVRAKAYHNRGLLRVDQPARMAEAEADYTAAIETDGAHAATRAKAYHDRGVLRAHQPERTAEAEADYTAAIETGGAHAATRASAYLNRGFLGADQPGRASEVEADYTAAIETESADAATRAKAYHNRGLLRAHQSGRASEAEADYTAAIETDAADADTRASAYLNRGALRADQPGRASEVEADYTAAIETESADAATRAKAYHNRGLLRAHQSGRASAAEADFRAAIRFAPPLEAERCVRAFADILRSQGRLGDELALYRELIRTRRLELVTLAVPRLAFGLAATRVGIEPWVPGRHGRAILYRPKGLDGRGAVLSWAVDRTGAPPHQQVIKAARIPTRTLIAILSIEPDGHFTVLTDPRTDPAKLRATIAALEPRLRP
jgi:hypothetical protein